MVEITGWQMVLSYVCEGTAGSELGMQRAASKIYEMINWWLEKGIAGFRIDAITFIKKDLSFASRPTMMGNDIRLKNLRIIRESEHSLMR